MPFSTGFYLFRGFTFQIFANPAIYHFGNATPDLLSSTRENCLDLLERWARGVTNVPIFVKKSPVNVGQIVFFKFFRWLFSRLAARSCVIVLSVVSASDRLAVQRRTHAHQCEIPHFLSWSRFASVVAVDREFFLKENRKFARKNVHRYAKLVCWIDLKMSSENDSVSPPVNFEKCSLVLVDVAGTTTSIDFVKVSC
jgi:hypothetical protein